MIRPRSKFVGFNSLSRVVGSSGIQHRFPPCHPGPGADFNILQTGLQRSVRQSPGPQMPELRCLPGTPDRLPFAPRPAFPDNRNASHRTTPRPAAERVRLVPSAVHLAQEVGARLGACALLLGRVSTTRARRPTRDGRRHSAPRDAQSLEQRQTKHHAITAGRQRHAPLRSPDRVRGEPRLQVGQPADERRLARRRVPSSVAGGSTGPRRRHASEQ